MERVGHKMDELIQRQKRLLDQSQATTESRSAKDKSQYIMAIGGIAAGLTIAVMVWLVKSIVMTNHVESRATDTAVTIHRGEIKMLSDDIAQLSGRMESLNVAVSTLETRFNQLMRLTESIADIETEKTSSPQQVSATASSESTQTVTDSEKVFDPTHIVKTKVNLRPAASLNSTPIAVLNPGTEVEYISKSAGWYYVNTQSHGNGWCSSDYLSPLSSTQRKSPAK